MVATVLSASSPAACPERVVDGLKPVEIEGEDRHGLAVVGGEALLQAATVAQAREWIAFDEPSEFVALALHAEHHDHHAPRKPPDGGNH